MRPTATVRFALTSIYTSYLRNIAAAFVELRGEERIREAVLHLTAHHQGGLKHLFETAANAHAASTRGGIADA